MSAPTTNQTPFSPEYRSFWLRRLHSLSGVVPVGIFLVFHLMTNAKGMQGRQPFADAVDDIHHIPYLLVVEILTIYAPLLFHALYGIKIGLEARPNVGMYPSQRNWAYLLQRVTGVLSFGFIAYHLWQFRIQVALGRMHPQDFFGELCAELSSTTQMGIPVVAVVYLLGVAATCYHFANGLSGFCFTWGITRSQRSARFASGVFGIVGIGLFVLGANTVLYFATGARIVLAPGQTQAGALTCRNLDETAEARAQHAAPREGDR